MFDFKKCRDLEIWIRDHLGSLTVVPFDRLCMVSYYYPNNYTVHKTLIDLDFKNDVTLKTGLRVSEGH